MIIDQGLGGDLGDG